MRLVSDAGGTIWDTIHTVSLKGEATALSKVMDARPYRLKARLFNSLISRMICKATAADMDAVKAQLESQS